MSVDNFIPELWSGLILRAHSKTLVYGQAGVVNRDYEGTISQMGDTVRINSIGDPTISDYVKNTDMAGPETLKSDQRTLLIDAAKSFNFQVDDVDKAQASSEFLPEAMTRAGYRLKDVADQYIAAKMVAGAGLSIGSDASPVTIDAAAGNGVYELLVRAQVKLDNADVPTEDRFAVLPSWATASLSLDPRFIANIDGLLLNGVVGQAAGFKLLKSNNVPSTTASGKRSKFKLIAGSSGATSFAEQINQVEAYRPEARFADAVKGLHLYGAKVVRPEELLVITANDGLGLDG